MSPPRIHFAILTYNALDLTRRCFQSIVEHTGLPFAVTVLDNASRDGTQAYLRGLGDERFTVLESAVNLGVPGGRNVLLQQVLPQLPDDGFVVFLDNDIELQAGWCDPYLRLFEQQPRAGMASADGWVIEVRGDVRVPVLRPAHTARVDICAGGFACWARKAAALATGPFDEALGLFWHEDDDWSVRMAQAGWQVFVVPEAKMLHRAHASGVGTSLQDPRSLRNQAYLAAKWRAHGFIDQDGFVVARDAPYYLPPARRAELRQHLDRHTPLCRGEWAQAVWDHEELRRCEQEGVPFRRPVSPLLRTWLQGEVNEEPVASVRATGPSRACNAGDYDDPVWLAEHRALFGPEAGPDWYRRDRHQWAATTIVAGLRALGTLRPGATGVDLACLHGAALPAKVAAVLQEAGAVVHTTPGACDFAFGLGGPLVAGTEPRLQAMLDAAHRCLRPGGVLAIGVDLALDSRHAPEAASVRAALRQNGFEPCGATDLRTGDDLTSLPLPGLDAGSWPGLVSGRGSEAHTSAVLFARAGALPSLPPVPRAPVAWHCRVDLSGLGSTTALPPWQRHALQLLDSVAEGLPRVRFTLHLRRDPPPALWPLLRRDNVTCDTSTVGSDLTFHLVTGTGPVVTHGRRCAFAIARPVTAEPGVLYLEAADLGVPAAPPSPPAAALLTECGVARPYAIALFSPRELAAVVPVLQAFAMAGNAAHLILLGEAAPLLRDPVRSLSCGNRVHLLGPIDPESEAGLLRAASAGICLTEPDPRMATLAAAGIPVLAQESAFARRVLGASFRPSTAAALCEALRHEQLLPSVPAPNWSDVSAQVVQAWQRTWPELFARPVLAAVGPAPRVPASPRKDTK